MREKLELANEYRSLEKLYRDHIGPSLGLGEITLMNGEFIDIRLGVPLNCRDNVFLRMRWIRSKLKNINRFYHI